MEQERKDNVKRNNLPEKFQFLILDDKQTFRLYEERSVVGVKMLKAILGKTQTVDFRGETVNGFYMSDRNKEVGLLSQLYAGNAMFTVMNRYGVELREYQIQRTKETILYVLNYLEDNDNCYDLNPVLDPDVNDKLFVSSGNNYVGAMTWALSLFTSARVAQRSGIIEFTEKEQEQIFKQIKRIIKFFVENVVGTEAEPLGWGYTNGCTEPSLFFTYSVVEAFADFDDNVLGGILNDKEEQALRRDDELVDYINASIYEHDEEPLIDRFANLCFSIGDRAWDLYKDVLRTDCFSDRFDSNFAIIPKDEIFRSSRSSVLFNTLYVIFILFYSYTNARQKDEEVSKDIIETMRLALQLVQNVYDELTAMGKESIVDKHIIAFDQPHAQIKDFGKLLNEESIQASPFLPMFVKANNLISYYILKFPQKQMSEFFDQMINEMNEHDDWLWDKRRFDILSSERYFEAFADFFDYYDEYERNYADKAKSRKDIRDEIEEKLTPRLESKVKKELEKRHQDEIKVIRENMAAEFPIEAAMNERIDQKIQERAMGILTESINAIIAYNEAPNNEKDDHKKNFTDEQLQLKESIEKLIMSYLADDIRSEADDASEMDRNVLAVAVKDDFTKFVTAFVKFIAHYNANLPEEKKLSMADIFDIISNK